MGRTPVVKELGPGGGVGTMVRSESDCEVPGLPGGVRGSMERRAGARSAIAVDTARWISAWRFADMTVALVTLGGSGGLVVGLSTPWWVQRRMISWFFVPSEARPALRQVWRRSHTDMLRKDAAVGWSEVPELVLRDSARITLGRRPAAVRRGMVQAE